MIAFADALRDLFEPILPGFDWQFGRWQETEPKQRYAVLRPVGGIGAQLIRQPQFTLMLIGVRGGDSFEISAAANKVVELCRERAPEAIAYVEAGEPVFVPTADGRPIFEIALSVISA